MTCQVVIFSLVVYYVYKKVTASGSVTVTVAMHGKQIPRGTMRSLCRQAGWTVEHLIQLVDKYK